MRKNWTRVGKTGDPMGKKQMCVEETGLAHEKQITHAKQLRVGYLESLMEKQVAEGRLLYVIETAYPGNKLTQNKV